jgi:drug/metabolite transporter (DMT)-like permease
MNALQTGLALVGVNFVYACTSIFMKIASQQVLFSIPFFLWLGGAVGMMGIYALLWQQVIMRMELSTAYMFKGLSLIFVLLFSVFLFGEAITVNNLIGAILIITGIVFFAKA